MVLFLAAEIKYPYLQNHTVEPWACLVIFAPVPGERDCHLLASAYHKCTQVREKGSL